MSDDKSHSQYITPTVLQIVTAARHRDDQTVELMINELTSEERGAAIVSMARAINALITATCKNSGRDPEEVWQRICARTMRSIEENDLE